MACSRVNSGTPEMNERVALLTSARIHYMQRLVEQNPPTRIDLPPDCSIAQQRSS